MLEHSLHSKSQFEKFTAVMEEYSEMEQAVLVPVTDLQKLPNEVFYLPMHAVRNEHSTTTVRVVFNATAKSATLSERHLTRWANCSLFSY